MFEAEYDWHNTNITIPDNLFRNNEKNKAGDIGTGVLDVFDRYNFTIKEDEPLDKEVAVDPEMLGKVFENMLDITERKSKGAFYTPREIVHYMCQESLIHYLDNSLNSGSGSYQELGSDQIKLFSDSKTKKGQAKIEIEHNANITVPKKDIEIFIRKGHFVLENDERVAVKGKTKTYQYKLPESIRNNADLIDKKLCNIKICDPAIGSGAFPVGLLHELVNAMLVLKTHLSYDYLTKKLKALGFEHRESVNDSRYIYRLKRHIIQESIYGVDIDASAIDIARLRLWLSLVVDEDDLDPIETLPNLDYKIVVGNSLIGLPGNAMRDLEVEAQLEKLKEKFYNITNEKEKKELRQQINDKIRELLDSAEQFVSYKIDFDFKLFFSEVWREKGGFDIVIGNPPYVSGKDLDNEFKQFAKTYYSTAQGQFDLFSLFIERAIVILNSSGIHSFIIPDSFMGRSTFEVSRKYFIEKTNPKIFLHFSDAFKSATVSSFIYVTTKEKKESKITFYSTDKLEDWLLGKIKESSISSSIFSLSGKLKFTYISERESTVLKKIRKFRNLDKFSFMWRGEEIGRNSSKIKKSINADISDFYPIITGGNIHKFKIKDELGFIKREDIDKNFESYQKQKVVIGQLGSTLQSAVDDKKRISTQAVYNIIPDKLSTYYVSVILNSQVSNFLYKILFQEKKDFPRILLENLKELSLPVENIPHETIENLYHYCSFLNTSASCFYFFESITESIVFELYFPDEIKSAGKEILKHLQDLQPITDKMSEEKKLATIQSEYDRLSAPNHPVRLALDTLDNVEEVRIIKEALK